MAPPTTRPFIVVLRTSSGHTRTHTMQAATMQAAITEALLEGRALGDDAQTRAVEAFDKEYVFDRDGIDLCLQDAGHG